MKYIRQLNALGNADVALVGGKNASLGEMVSRPGAHGVSVPNGFATIAQAYFDFLSSNTLTQKIRARLSAWCWNRSENSPVSKTARGRLAMLMAGRYYAVRRHVGSRPPNP